VPVNSVAIRTAAKRPSIRCTDAGNQLQIGVHGASLLIKKAKKMPEQQKIDSESCPSLVLSGSG
jgi:hypothetical protein